MQHTRTRPSLPNSPVFRVVTPHPHQPQTDVAVDVVEVVALVVVDGDADEGRSEDVVEFDGVVAGPPLGVGRVGAVLHRVHVDGHVTLVEEAGQLNGRHRHRDVGHELEQGRRRDGGRWMGG